MYMFIFCKRDIFNNVNISPNLQDDLPIHLRNCAFWAVSSTDTARRLCFYYFCTTLAYVWEQENRRDCEFIMSFGTFYSTCRLSGIPAWYLILKLNTPGISYTQYRVLLRKEVHTSHHIVNTLCTLTRWHRSSRSNGRQSVSTNDKK